MLFDSHSHVNDEAFTGEVEAILQNARDHGVAKMAVVGADWESSVSAVEFAQKYAPLYAMVGIHPHDSETYCDEMEESFRRWLTTEPKVVAVGEIGLDYYRDLSPRDVQQIVFRRQLKLAQELGVPFAIHCREAMEDTIRILKEEKQGEYRGIFHCFSGSYEQAQVALRLGFHISFAGPVTYPNARKLQEVAAKIPLSRILIETDCPYLSPQPQRGKRNEPANVRFVAEKIAELRGCSIEEIAAATYDNTCALLHIEESL